MYRALSERVAQLTGVVMVIGDTDTGKTSLSKVLAAESVKAGRTVAYIDADIAASTVGSAACVGLKILRDPADFTDLATPDAMRFVGSTDPNGVVLPHVVAVASLVSQARSEADLIILDTTGVVAGVVGQTLKYHLAEITGP
ncbi:MAG: Clp1/GlmU family protein, partial [Actinomycetota bacterium]|nr:Clp1/GlmU family protein [Actinomycetota bacterium]